MSAISEFQPQFLEEDEPDLMIQFDESAFEPAPTASAYQGDEDFDEQVHVAQEQLLHLRQKQEQLERQKTELEELSLRKEEFTEGRAEIAEKLSSYVSSLETEAVDAQKLADDCLDTKEIFEHHLRSVECLRPESWARSDLKAELGRAMSYIEMAENELAKASPLLRSISGKKKMFKSSAAVSTGASVGSDQPFSYWVKAGLAFTLPLMGFVGVFGLIMRLLG